MENYQLKINQLKDLKKQKVEVSKKLNENEDFKKRMEINKSIKNLMNEIMGDKKEDKAPKEEPKKEPKSEPKPKQSKKKQEPRVEGLRLIP